MTECDTGIIKKGISLLGEKSYDEALKVFDKARRFYKDSNSTEYISVSLSLFGLTLYLKDKSRYEEVLRILNDARYMAELSKSTTAKVVKEQSLMERA